MVGDVLQCEYVRLLGGTHDKRVMYSRLFYRVESEGPEPWDVNYLGNVILNATTSYYFGRVLVHAGVTWMRYRRVTSATDGGGTLGWGWIGVGSGWSYGRGGLPPEWGVLLRLRGGDASGPVHRVYCTPCDLNFISNSSNVLVGPLVPYVSAASAETLGHWVLPLTIRYHSEGNDVIRPVVWSAAAGGFINVWSATVANFFTAVKSRRNRADDQPDVWDFEEWVDGPWDRWQM